LVGLCNHKEMKVVKVNMKITGITLLAIGIVFIVLENVFYGDVNADGVLQEGLFMPLGALVTIIGLLLLVVCVIKYFYQRLKGKLTGTPNFAHRF